MTRRPADKPCLILVNLGSPDEPTKKSVRTYLREFLSDRRVVETHPVLWRPVLDGIILQVRPKKSAEKYAMVWGETYPPLVEYTIEQANAVQDSLGESAEVRYAMRYGSTGLQSALKKAYEDGYRKVAVFPLYPQYSASSLGTISDEVFRYGLKARDQFDLRITRSFQTFSPYIEAMAAALETSWEENGRPDFASGDKLILSYHGIPQAMADKGDPYPIECQETTVALRARLGLGKDDIVHSYQSKFGPAPWLLPATIDSVAELGAGGTNRVDVLCPGFVSDCLETLEEIEMLNREAFVQAGGRNFNYVSWGNGNQLWLEALIDLSKSALAGWI